MLTKFATEIHPRCVRMEVFTFSYSYINIPFLLATRKSANLDLVVELNITIICTLMQAKMRPYEMTTVEVLLDGLLMSFIRLSKLAGI